MEAGVVVSNKNNSAVAEVELNLCALVGVLEYFMSPAKQCTVQLHLQHEFMLIISFDESTNAILTGPFLGGPPMNSEFFELVTLPK